MAWLRYRIAPWGYWLLGQLPLKWEDGTINSPSFRHANFRKNFSITFTIFSSNFNIFVTRLDICFNFFLNFSVNIEL